MPFSFPSSPTVGQQSTQNQRVYQWTGSAWELVSVPATINSTNISDATVAGRALITAADAAAQRTSLGLGTMATQASSSYLPVAGGTMTGQLLTTAGSVSAPGIAISGDANCGLAQLGGADTLGVVTAGVERWRVRSDGSIQSVTPGGSTLLPQFACRAWVNFNGTGTVAIRSSGNVSSITDNGVGSYIINFTTAMPDANYSASVCPAFVSGTTFNVISPIHPTGVLAASLQIQVHRTDSNIAIDSAFVCVSIFR